MRENSHGRILRREPKEQYLSTVPKICPIIFTLYPTPRFFFPLILMSNIFFSLKFFECQLLV